MELKEIQINDWVRIYAPDAPDLGYRDGKVDQDTFREILNDRKRNGGLFAGIVFDHVPLEEQILLLNGFKQIGSSYVLDGFALRNPSLPEEHTDDYWFQIGGNEIQVKSVLQLQHLLRDCFKVDVADNFRIK